MKKVFICTVSALSFISINMLNASAQQLECFDRICVEAETVESVNSLFPAAPSYPVMQFYGTKKQGNGTFQALMEVDCQTRQFRTVRMRNGRRWQKFDPRWSPKLASDPLVDYVCELQVDESGEGN